MEDTVYVTSYTLYNLVCNSGNWGLAKNVPVIYSADVLVDSRDGKKYKLVTYEIGDSSQTWMADDLMFNSPDGNYLYPDAIAMDSTIVMQSYDECVEYWVGEWMRGRTEDLSYKDTLAILSSCDEYMQNRSAINYERFWPAVDSVVAEKGFVQGICPDGWRLPSGHEWETLMEKIAYTFVDPDEEYSIYRAPEYFEVSGFGSVLRPDGDNPWRESEAYYAMAPDSSYRAPEFSDLAMQTVTFIRFSYSYWDILPRALNTDMGSVVRVRCIKE